VSSDECSRLAVGLGGEKRDGLNCVIYLMR
jgi:hypothetical protein